MLEARADRMALMRRAVAELTDEEMKRMSDQSPAPDFPDERYSVGECLGTVMAEECEHYRYAMRDLEVLEARG